MAHQFELSDPTNPSAWERETTDTSQTTDTTSHSWTHLHCDEQVRQRHEQLVDIVRPLIVVPRAKAQVQELQPPILQEVKPIRGIFSWEWGTTPRIKSGE